MSGCFWVSSGDYASRWDLDGDGVARPSDCDDRDPEVARRTWFLDADGDGHGDQLDGVESCAPVAGRVELSDDCDDDDATTWTGAPELCDGVDNDCDAAVDEDLQFLTWYPDADGDTFGDADKPVEDCAPPAGHVADGTDCDDTTRAVSPAASELCNGIDDDCDDDVDLADADLDLALFTWYRDMDADGYGRDNQTVTQCTQPDGYAAVGGDCDDDDPYRNPGQDEICDGLENNCDGLTDGPDAVDAEDYYEDADLDGYGNPYVPIIRSCTPEVGLVLVALGLLDCDDTDPTIHPGACELCDGENNDCDAEVDEDCGACDTGGGTG